MASIKKDGKTQASFINVSLKWSVSMPIDSDFLSANSDFTEKQVNEIIF